MEGGVTMPLRKLGATYEKPSKADSRLADMRVGEGQGESSGFWSVQILSKFSTLCSLRHDGLKGDVTCSNSAAQSVTDFCQQGIHAHSHLGMSVVTFDSSTIPPAPTSRSPATAR